MHATGSNIHAGTIVTNPEPSSTWTPLLGHVVRYLDSEPFAHKAGANDSESLIPDRHGQNVWGIALGRKNWIHIGNQQAGPRVATILSVVESCRRLSIPFRDYLNQILSGLANRSVQQLADLTPASWIARHNPDCRATTYKPNTAPRQPCAWSYAYK